ncbi:hypothetical protein TanjilG_16357 [Lupinus angustifolius]|uniref:AB hydrolase-1 domain-containing protein n=1 Tax=Lupinus angustifolius TaxID=3871 RepID=A0A1J7H7E1_LUPAN|nr:hypothetical protein TanjilG_16357 [Lupinus angustifolius]
MEILSYASAPCFQLVDSERKSFNSHQSRFPTIGNHGLYCTNTISRCRTVKFYDMDQSSNFLHHHSEEGITDISEIDGANGESGASISSCFWEWKPKLNVHYEKAGCENVDSPHVLFLPGFGVGSFHFEKQLKELGRDTRVWALDFLGQGMSLPFEDPTPHYKDGDISNGNVSSWGFGDEAEPWATKLVYSIDLWQDQVRYFVEDVIGEAVYVVGNSLGGYVALYFAACNPHLVKGVTLLNATPFWGFLPNPVKSPGLAKVFPWAGTFSLPAVVRRLTEFVWKKISDPRSIGEILNQVYANGTTNVDNVFSGIIETASHPEAPYYEISPAGHCPHDEVPEHNGELKGGAKASRAGRPWICACIICGFADRSEACMFESKWKSLSRRAPGKKNENENPSTKHSEEPSVPLLQRRHAALNRVKASLDCTHLEINWHLDPL